MPKDSADAANPDSTSHVKANYRALPIDIWALGFVSMFMDVSSELIHSLLPILMVNELGASPFAVGMIEGIAEGTAATTKTLSGAISDQFRNRKFLVVFGYSLSALSKLVFPLANAIGWVFTASFVDRVGKGIRVAPRDALIADVVAPAMRGAAYGLRQALDSVGAFIGPFLAIAFMALFSNDIKTVFWVASIPAILAVVLLVFAVREPISRHQTEARKRLALSDIKLLPASYWLVVSLGGVFTLARFSEAFLVLRAQDIGLPIGLIPTIMIVMNIVYAAFAYPAGILADRFPARSLLVIGLGLLIVADAVLALTTSLASMYIGAGIWGLHMAFTQGLLSKLVADSAPDRLRGTAFGLFSLVSGASLLLASSIAGGLWNVFGPTATFGSGAVIATLSAIGLILYRPKEDKTQNSDSAQF